MNKKKPDDPAGRKDNSALVGDAKKPSTPNEKADLDEDRAFAELVKDAPPPVRAMIMEMTRMSSSSRLGHPLFDKFTPQHIDKFLDYCQKDDDNNYKLASSSRLFHLAYVIVFVAFLIFLITYLLPSNKDLLSDILKILVSFAGGLGVGFGWKSRLDKKR